MSLNSKEKLDYAIKSKDYETLQVLEKEALKNNRTLKNFYKEVFRASVYHNNRESLTRILRIYIPSEEYINRALEFDIEPEIENMLETLKIEPFYFYNALGIFYTVYGIEKKQDNRVPIDALKIINEFM